MTDGKVEVSQEDIDRVMGKPQKTAQQIEMDAIKKTMAGIKHKIIVCSGKGGVGKSTVAANLAIALASQGLNVGILDVDITGPNIAKMLNLEGQRPEVLPGENLFLPINGPLNIKVMSMAFLLETPDTPVIWRGPMKMKAIRQFLAEGKWGSMDYLVSDLPPGTSDETLDIMQLTEGDVVIVTTPQDVATLDSRKTVMMAKGMKRNVVGIVENMSGFSVECPDCHKTHTYDLFGSGGGEKAAQELKVPFLGSIPIEQGIRQGGDDGLPFTLKDPESASSKAFQDIVSKIRKSLE
ncbi:Iron-sulfur cluster carrier protein [Candidatus Lokiarchaeum ossiferum]|uniref:Iron-sulfur cluster carrier protein n=1 Tax=Candidatus Lokiarchaeum ossiferum TaxID=2951803 RepID=A0ABY6HVV8_9ARCH|nr:Iron-sulfur cluster carrier protein [Candidatus Lokiarchaeum sp. B-35]